MKGTKLKTISAIINIMVGIIIFVGCAKNETVETIATINRGSFEQPVDIDDVDFLEIDTEDNTPLGYMPIDEDIAKGSDELAAVLHLMQVAEHNYYRAENVAKVSMGGGEAEASVLVGKMAVRSLYIREEEEVYSQCIGRVYEGNKRSLLSAAQLLLDQGKRSYTINYREDNETIYKQEPNSKGNPTMVDDQFPFATCDFSKGKLKTFNNNNPDKDFSLKYKGELTNFVISEESILDDSFSVEYDEETNVYTIIFEIDVTTQEARDAYTEKPRASLRDSSGSKNLEYNKYKFTMELWGNGLIQTYTSEESWEATLKLGLEVSGASNSISTDYFSWDEDDCEIEEYEEDGIIDLNWIP